MPKETGIVGKAVELPTEKVVDAAAASGEVFTGEAFLLPEDNPTLTGTDGATAGGTLSTPPDSPVVVVEIDEGTASGSLDLPFVLPMAYSAFRAATPPRKRARTSLAIAALSSAAKPSPTSPMRATVSAVHASCDDEAASAKEAMVDSGSACGCTLTISAH